MSRDLTNDARVRTAAGRLRVAVIVVMALIAASLVLAWTGADFGNAHVEMRGHGAGNLLNPLVGGTLGILLAEIALWKLVQMLGAVAQGEMFSLRVIGHFRGFAFWLMLMALADIALPLIASIANSSRGSDGEAHVALPLDLSSLIMVGVTFLLFLLARLLERARLVDEENREIV